MFLKLHRTRPEVELVKLEQSLLTQVPKERSLVSCAMFLAATKLAGMSHVSNMLLENLIMVTVYPKTDGIGNHSI